MMPNLLQMHLASFDDAMSIYAHYSCSDGKSIESKTSLICHCAGISLRVSN